MEAFGVRRDRAEVMGVAAVVFTTLGEWLGAKQLLVPAVGVREGILLGILNSQPGMVSQVAVAATWISRAISFVAELAISLVLWMAVRGHLAESAEPVAKRRPEAV